MTRLDKSGFRRLSLGAAACLIALFAVSSAEDSDRESWQPPDEILDAAGVLPGMRVGEAGAGTGYLTFPLATRVGSS